MKFIVFFQLKSTYLFHFCLKILHIYCITKQNEQIGNPSKVVQGSLEDHWLKIIAPHQNVAVSLSKLVLQSILQNFFFFVFFFGVKLGHL